MDWKQQFVEWMFPFNQQDLRLEQALQLKHAHLPERLYKYRAFDPQGYALQNLREGTVWLADPTSFNDPYDCGHTIDMARMAADTFRRAPERSLEGLPAWLDSKQIVEALEGTDDPLGDLIERLLDAVPTDQRERTRQAMKDVVAEQRDAFADDAVTQIKHAFKLCAFSERLDSTLMWAHYSDYHTGFCVEYDIRALPPSDWVSRFMCPVIYSDALFDATEHVLRGTDSPDFYNLHWNLAGLRKATDWSYEQEWRLLFTNGVLNAPQAWPMPKPTAVYLGSHTRSGHQAELLEICRGLDVPVRQMQLSKREYRMTPGAVLATRGAAATSA